MLNHFVHLEDDPNLLAILKTALNTIHPDVTVAQFANSEELLAYMQDPLSPVDMVMLDIRIVGAMSGLDAAARLRAMGYSGPMIISSAYEPPNRQTLVALSAEYIAKPWRIETLLERLMAHREVTVSAPLNTYVPLLSPRPTVQSEYVTFTVPLKRNLEHISRLVIQSLQVQGVGMLVADTQEGAILYFDVYPGRHMADDAFLALATGIMREGKPVSLSDATAYLTANDRISFAGVPFLLKSMGLSGSLCVYDIGKRAWTDTDLALLYRAVEIFSYLVKLGKTSAELTQHNDELNAFTDTIAHDLKTPLSAILNYVEMIKLLFSATLTPEVNQYLSQISHSADIMKDMITQLLWIARLDNPIESVSAVDMHDVVQSALQRLSYALQSRRVQVTVSPHLPPVLGHDVWIEEALANLISNAIKYMGEDNRSPAIHIRGFETGSQVRYEVADNGIGISAEDQGKLFRHFSRLNTVQVEGVGLGLAIVHRMITKLNGQIGVVSTVGSGSIFWFTLPVPPTIHDEEDSA